MPLTNPVSVPVFVELIGDDAFAVGTINTWISWDISAIVPVGTLAVSVGMKTGANSGDRGVRKGGSSEDRFLNQPTSTGVILTMICEVDENRVIECYAPHATTDKFGILGYWQ